MEGWIELKGLRCLGQHGVLAEERASPRLFVVDLGVRLDVAPAAASDDLTRAVDLAALANTAIRVIEGASRALLETLAVQIVNDVLARFPEAAEVRVRLAKPEPPGIPAAEEAVAVQVNRQAPKPRVEPGRARRPR